MSELQQSAQFFKALSEPVRLRILNLLLHSDAEICVCALIEALDIPQSVISRHLAYLRKAELVQARREGCGCTILCMLRCRRCIARYWLNSSVVL